ncbi:hypothetical protein HMPREF0645_2699 [Hallella bergensis DSM 17361]|uniref:Uncharacterized protein n=1 Tax=Hallella bergensis DSM 17361 TaxID=585502 RepID=D1Q0G4_9BACT|nr:hypothetical protein HMPREF0645_2699 [Hallella bergensis DSM 17361]
MKYSSSSHTFLITTAPCCFPTAKQLFGGRHPHELRPCDGCPALAIRHGCRHTPMW